MPEEVLKTYLTPLLQFPSDLVINRTDDEQGVLLTVDAHKSDLGVIIGKGGETAKALRSIMRSVGAKQQQRVAIKIATPRRI